MPDDQEANIEPSTELPSTEVEGHQPQVPELITELRTIEEQVGMHVIAALRREGTVAVLTAVLPGHHGDRIASVPLNQDMWMKVQELLTSATEANDEAPGEVPCVGFQCVLRDRAEEEDRKKQQAPPDNI